MTRISERKSVIAAGAAKAGLIAAAGLGVALILAPVSMADTFVKVPAPAIDATAGSATETAVLAGGCFWGVQAVFQHTKGVKQAVSGYAGGDKAEADYQMVSSGRTGHAEVVQITYDPQQISYGRLLQIYFSVAHDPTQLDRQGPDVGPQYRSAIFTTNDEQAKVAGGYIAQLDAAKVFDKPIATTVGPLPEFYAAEDYHQDYATLHPDSAYIAMHDAPKVAELAKMFPEVYRATPALVFAATQ